MVPFHSASDKCGNLFSLKVLLVTAAYFILSAKGQVGVSLKYRGATIPNGSFVYIYDVHYYAYPRNRDPRNGALLCVTDLEDCCDAPHTVHGDWYFPDGRRVESDHLWSDGFRAIRYPNDVINEQRVYGSVYLYRGYYDQPQGRGLFRCELPSAANPSINQTLYANIFGFEFRRDHDLVTISPSTGSTATTAGERDYSLNCSATLIQPSHLPPGGPSPSFQWLFYGSSSLPSGVTALPTVMSSSNSTSATYTSTLQFSPLNQSHAGMYQCQLGPHRLMKSIVITVNDVYPRLSLKGVVYANNSVIRITQIGETNSYYYSDDQNDGLQCITDRSQCCFSIPNRFGEWYFPDGNPVPPIGSARTFYRNRRDDGTVYLNRINTNISSPTGLFCCELPDAVNVIHRVCANIISTGVLINPSPVGIPTAGQAYSLNCSIITGVADTVTFQWFKGQGSNGTQLTNTSQLQFSSLRASDAGLYTCQTTIIQNSTSVEIEETAATVIVSFLAAPSVTVTPPVAPIIVGSSISLSCTVELSPLVDVPVTVSIEWTGPAGFMTSNTTQPVMGSPTTTYTSTAMVNSSRSGREQSGNYTCKATVRAMSSSLIDSVGYSSSRVIVVPEPIVSVHSDSPNHVFYGHPPTLTCTVEVSSEVNIPLSMTTVWKGPDGTIVASPTELEMKSLTLYTSSSSRLTSVDSADVDSGEYTCIVRFENGVEISASTIITIVDGMFQLRLKSVGICQQWHSESSDTRKLYSNCIKDALVTAIKHRCKCHFPITRFNKDIFICEDSPNVMIYRNALIGTHNFNGTQIVDFIQDWVSTGPLVEVGGNSMRVDSSCAAAISSLDEPVCGEKEKCLYDNDPKYTMCAQHLTDTCNNIANCFEGCVIRNG